MSSLTSLPADTPASLSVLPGSKKAIKTTATSGRECLKLLNTSDPLGSLLKTLLVTSEWASTTCYLTWKPKATPRGRLLFQLVPSTPPTDETAFGLLPTPRAAMTGALHPNRCQDKNPNLETVLSQIMWPTPRASEHKSVGPLGSKSQAHMLGKRYLCAVVQDVEQTSGALNPQWVEWLMGYPIDHTE